LEDGVELGDGTALENCIVGERSRIGRRCKLKDTVIWEESTLGDDVSMRNCVVCDRVDVGSRVSALKGAIIAEKVKIEDDVRIEKDVVIWPEKFVESGSIVSSNLVWGKVETFNI
jgi:mannose-1-phosphate guanylyltransferase/phosphomannomutase